MTYTMKLYHNPRCSKSRAAHALVGEKAEVIDYCSKPLSVAELRRICVALDIAPKKLLRTGEKIYKQLAKRGDPDDEQALQWMHKHPILMERPILIMGSRAVIGRPPERIMSILE